MSRIRLLSSPPLWQIQIQEQIHVQIQLQIQIQEPDTTPLQTSTMEPANTNTRANTSANTIIQKHINTNTNHPAPLHWHQKQPKNCRKYGNGSSSPLHRVTMVRANIRIHIEIQIHGDHHHSSCSPPLPGSGC